ncbi:hypothetical protein HJG60_011025 [Phyllostomus discolor]|uniref:Uncharacterized protein n=1 Tax=Phyllostomus discolor TaxID=89673 RepID=A0A834EAF7_9CHIR|nr:hypothetical protein HJG60_011025 [Phyllostomus discolor]
MAPSLQVLGKPQQRVTGYCTPVLEPHTVSRVAATQGIFALRKQRLGFVLAVFHMRCEPASRTPTRGCSQLLSNGAFPPTSPTLHHTHTHTHTHTQAGSFLRSSRPSPPRPAVCLAVPRQDLLLQLKTEVTAPSPSPPLSSGTLWEPLSHRHCSHPPLTNWGVLLVPPFLCPDHLQVLNG